MEKTSAQRLVRETLKASFDRRRFRDFVNELCNGFDESKAQNMTVPDAFVPHIRSCYRLGTFTADGGEKADVLVVTLTESMKLERTRTALRDYVAHKLKRDESYKEAGLVAFVSPDDRSWRFSFIRMEYQTKRDPKTGKIKPEERLTPARRYSYLVGEDEQCHTAQTRFLRLLQETDRKPGLLEIEEAFSVETVTKEFFSEYVRLFEAGTKALESVLRGNAKLKAEFKEKRVTTIDFTKKLMGQIVFLYFIQKKGWLGVPKGEAWGQGPWDFLRRLAIRAQEKKQNLFNDIFEPLFYDTLATDRGHESWCKVFESRIPFLNGGLFEPLNGYDWENTRIDLPDSLFTNTDLTPDGDQGTGILDVFDRYNFTVNEAEPLEIEVAIDPEMLGKVFENLIEENRRKGLGAFYTPREIVHYLCQESLINYLDSSLNHPQKPLGAGTPGPDKDRHPALCGLEPEEEAEAGQQDILEAGSRTLATRQELSDWIHQSEQFSHYEAAIAAGTQGSHYPKPPKAIVEYAREIDALLRDITVCDPAIGSGAFPVGMLTEIVRARAALTPYFNDIAERSFYHLKRHAIQSSIYGVDIDAGAVEIAKLRLWLSLVVDEEDVKQIKPLPNLDFKIVVGNSLLGVEKNLFNQKLFAELEELKPKYFDEADRKKKAKFKVRIDALIHEITQGHQAFDFEIYFSEIFHSKGGFDVLIANPPYLRLQGIQESQPKLVPIYKQRFKSAKGSFDLYALFIERAYELLHGTGHLAFIVPHKFFQATFGKGLRELLNKAAGLKQVVRFGSEQVFESATTYTCLLFLSRERNERFKMFEVGDILNLTSVFDAMRMSRPDGGYTFSELAHPQSDSWDFQTGKGGEVLKKLAEQGVTLSDVTRKIFVGLQTSADKIYVLKLLKEKGGTLTCYSKQLDEKIEIEKGLTKPFLMGKNVHRYAPPQVENVVLFPYEIKDGSAELMSQSFIKKTFPLGWKYLAKNREDLEAREKGRMVGERFYAYIYPKNLTEFDAVKIMTPEIALGCQMTIDDAGELYHTTKVYSFVFNEKNKSNPFYLLGVLNSPVLWFFIKSTGYVLSGGYYTFKTEYLKPFPIPCSLSAHPPTKAQEAEIADLVKERFKLGKSPEKHAATIAVIERKIDAAVYKLYRLNDDEVALVEAAKHKGAVEVPDSEV